MNDVDTINGLVGRSTRRRHSLELKAQVLHACEQPGVWLFCGSELAGKRAAVVMSLVQSAKLNGHDPWAYLMDVLARLPTHPSHRIDALLPHIWQPPD